MFNSVVLDVVIGLLFIYLLYSLLATILSEIVATALNLRARNLKEAIDRMLNDDKYRYWIGRLWDSIYLLNSPRNPVVNAFYEHPEIKYQGSSGVYKRPSNFKAGSFSKTIIALLAGKDPLDRQTLEEKLKNATISLDPVKEIEESPNRRNSKKFFKKVKLIINWLFDQKRSSLELEPNEISDAVKRKINEIYTGFNKDWEKVKPELEKYLKESVEEPKAIKIGTETSKYLRSLWQESQGDIEKFKLLLEDWFEKTMVHTLEWYKRKIRFVTFVLGFLIAWFFNADTFVIVKTISVDKDARDKLVTMATTYVQNNQFAKDTAKVRSAKELEDYNARLDSLMAIRDQIQSDIAKANNILGFGSWPPDTVSVTINPKLKTGEYMYDFLRINIKNQLGLDM